MSPSPVRLFVQAIPREFPGAKALRRKSADENVIIVSGVEDGEKFDRFIENRLILPLLQTGKEPPTVVVEGDKTI